jgi:hypothetical protein
MKYLMTLIQWSSQSIRKANLHGEKNAKIFLII